MKTLTVSNPLLTIEAHPAAALLPMLDDIGLQEMADDIVKNGQLEPISVIDTEGGMKLLDGRNRIAAIKLIGDPVVRNAALGEAWKKRLPAPRLMPGKRFDPIAFVIAKNLKRRHLTGEQKRELIAKLLRANPKRSNRATAKLAQVDNKTVAAVRAKAEATAEIPQLDKRVGDDGKTRRQPVAKIAPVAKARPATTASANRNHALGAIIGQFRVDPIGFLEDLVKIIADERTALAKVSAYRRGQIAAALNKALGQSLPPADPIRAALGAAAGEVPYAPLHKPMTALAASPANGVAP